MFKFNLLQSDTEPAVWELCLVSICFANSCQQYITKWLCELRLKQSSHLLLQWGPANPTRIQFSSHLCCLHTSQQIVKITFLQRVTFSFGWYWKSLNYFFHSAYQGVSIVTTFIFIINWQDPFQYKNYFINSHGPKRDKRSEGNYIMKSLMIRTPHPILCWW
jgi:hypothetical protein